MHGADVSFQSRFIFVQISGHIISILTAVLQLCGCLKILLSTAQLVVTETFKLHCSCKTTDSFKVVGDMML